MKLDFQPYTLKFNFPAGTSRGILNEKQSVIIKAETTDGLQYGEASFIPNLSIDSPQEVLDQLQEYKKSYEASGILTNMSEKQTPSLQFAIESMQRQHLENDFLRGESGIPINGLIWMGDIAFMEKQIKAKLAANYKVIKIKIGAIGWEREYDLLKKIREKYPKKYLELRVDANGAFSFDEALNVLEQLYKLDIHSIEQPIKKGQLELMQRLCANTPVPIALDEELIGISDFQKKKEIVAFIKPQYLILKPGLLGGFRSCEDWIEIATDNNAGYWVTSALESNIGLGAIAQWTSQLETTMPQGLGTGGLYLNNIPSPLEIRGDELFYNPEKNWDYSALTW